jgi:hypothetical protein
LPDAPKSLLEPDGESDKVADAAASLAEKLEAAKDARKEERFLWITVAVILIDVLWFKDSPNPVLPIVVLVLELIILVVLARRMGIDDVVELVDRFLHTVGNKAAGDR